MLEMIVLMVVRMKELIMGNGDDKIDGGAEDIPAHRPGMSTAAGLIGLCSSVVM